MALRQRRGVLGGFDGGYGIDQVHISNDDGGNWQAAELGTDLGRYSFREWSFAWKPRAAGKYRLHARAINRVGESQPMQALWNPSGYLRNTVDSIDVEAA